MNLLQHLRTHIIPLTIEDWFQKLKEPLKLRPFYEVNEHTIHIGQVIARFIGIPFDEDEYYNHLYEYVYGDDATLLLLKSDSLNRNINQQHLHTIEKILARYDEEKLSIETFVALLYDEQLIIKSTNPVLQNKILEATVRLFSRIFKEENDLNRHQLSIMLTIIIHWIRIHISTELRKVNLEKTMPKILWYGDANRKERYLVYFFILLGCDVVTFQPNGEDVLATFDSDETMGYVHRYPNKKVPDPFPNEKRRRSATVAYRASREIEAMLNHEGSGLYKPWQLRNHTPSSLTFKTTYDELFILAKEKAMIRPHFTVKNGQVRIPVVFSKVQGVSKNRKEYWNRLHSLMLSKNSLLIKQFPFKSYVNRDFRFHYDGAIGEDGLLQPEVMIRSHYWRYGHLSLGLQRGIAHAVKNICRYAYFKPIHHETKKDVRVFLFTQSMQVPAKILKLLQTFDYSQEVPKLILYNNGLHGTLSRTDAAMLLLLNQFGIDIVIYNPAGLSDIEKYIDESVYDIHWLEDVIFEQEFREPSFFKKLFSGSYFNN